MIAGKRDLQRFLMTLKPQTTTTTVFINTCPASTQCYNGQCIFQAGADKSIKDPSQYISAWGYARCDQKNGCLCGKKRCKNQEFCRNGLCLWSPYYDIYEGKMIYSAPTTGNIAPDEEYEYDGTLYEMHDGYQDVFEDLSEIAVLDYSYYIYTSFIEEVPFFFSWKRDRPQLCNTYEMPKNVEDYACMIGHYYVWGHGYMAPIYTEFNWACRKKEGCSCGENICPYGHTCFNNKECKSIYISPKEARKIICKMRFGGDDTYCNE